VKRAFGVIALAGVLALVAAGCGGRMTGEELRAGDLMQVGTGRGVQPGDPSTVGEEGDGVGAGDPSDLSGDPAVNDPSGGVGASGGGGGGAGPGGGGDTGGGDSGGGGDPTTGGTTPSNTPTGPLRATDVGVTPSQITLGLVTTLTGIVPGLFRGAVVGAQAWAAYQNSQGGILGRSVKFIVGDDKLSADEYRAQIVRLSPDVFAFVNNFSVYEEIGPPEVEKRGIPDVGFSISARRKASPMNWTPQPSPPGWRLGPMRMYRQRYGEEITKKVGALVVNVASPRQTWEWNKAALKSEGYELVYERFYQPTETDFTSDVIEMKDRGVEYITGNGDWQNFVRIAKAMQQQRWKPTLVNFGANLYDERSLELGASALEGAVIDIQNALYLGQDDAAVPEIGVMKKWIEQVSPGFKPDIFALYGWASGRLFAQAASAVGADLTRPKLLEALKNIHEFSANGLFPTADVGNKTPGDCFVLVVVKGGQFVREHPASGYECGGGFFEI
jgi:ABC-type branched-subunit amino acid transport system substrate-binding protein